MEIVEKKAQTAEAPPDDIAAEASGPNTAAALKPRFDFASITSSPAFIPGLLLFVGLVAAFSSLWAVTIPLWISDEYYSHGFLVPLISGFIVYRWWDRLKHIPVQASWYALPVVIGLMWVLYVSHLMEIRLLLSLALVGTLLATTWVVAGIRWMFALSAPILYLLFALPLWSNLIDRFTLPLQQISATVAFQLLRLFGMKPYQVDSTKVWLPNYLLDVGIPCSGLKLVLALSAFAVFFMLIARLSLVANLIFAASILPLALFINGLRIALIGVVGNAWGPEAGAQFHDYSGYITLILCFFILFKGARLLGWKD